jgi:hypothetical protein
LNARRATRQREDGMARTGRWRTGLGSALLLAAMAAAAQGPPGDWRDARPSVVLEMEPGTDTGSYDVVATISDLGSNRVLAQPRLQVQAGSTGVIEAGDAGGITLRLEVGVDATATRATWSFELRDGGEILTEQRATLTLSRPREASY